MLTAALVIVAKKWKTTRMNPPNGQNAGGPYSGLLLSDRREAQIPAALGVGFENTPSDTLVTKGHALYDSVCTKCAGQSDP